MLLFLIRLYQWTLSPFLGQCCRFYPTCSEYAIEAIKKRGALKALVLIFKRLIKCGPWHPGGVDEVP